MFLKESTDSFWDETDEEEFLDKRDRHYTAWRAGENQKYRKAAEVGTEDGHARI